MFWSSSDVVVPYLFYGMLRKYKIRFISKPAVTADFVALLGFSASMGSNILWSRFIFLKVHILWEGQKKRRNFSLIFDVTLKLIWTGIGNFTRYFSRLPVLRIYSLYQPFSNVFYPNLCFFKKFLAPLCMRKLSLGVAVLHVNEGLMDMAMLFRKLQFL